MQLETQHSEDAVEPLARHLPFTALEPVQVRDVYARRPSHFGDREIRGLARAPDPLVKPQRPSVICPADIVAPESAARHAGGMGIANELRRVRKSSGRTQAEISAATGIRQEHVSRIENGKRNTSMAALDAFADACGVRFIAVPKDYAVPEEIVALPDDRRDLLLRLARVLAVLPVELVADLIDRVEHWHRRYLGDSSATSQDTRASAS